jgi:ABC-type sugar transport system, permease component
MQGLPKKNGLDKLWDVLNYTLLGIVLLLTLYPFYYVFILSISNPRISTNNVFLFPAGFSLENYVEIFKLNNIVSAVVISVARTVIGTTLTVICCSFFAYLLTKKFFLKKLIYRMLIMTMYFNAGIIPVYITVKFYGLTNNFWVYVLPSAVNAFYIVLIKTFIEQIPPSLEESALIDGAGFTRIYWKIIMPVSKSIIATIIVFAAVYQWNAWFDNFLYVRTSQLLTLQLVLYNYLTQATILAHKITTMNNTESIGYKVSPLAVRMCITMVVTVPILFVYPFMQKYFIKGIMMGAIKG